MSGNTVEETLLALQVKRLAQTALSSGVDSQNKAQSCLILARACHADGQIQEAVSWYSQVRTKLLHSQELYNACHPVSACATHKLLTIASCSELIKLGMSCYTVSCGVLQQLMSCPVAAMHDKYHIVACSSISSAGHNVTTERTGH